MTKSSFMDLRQYFINHHFWKGALMELLYYNANVLTMDCPLKAHAVLTRDGVILAVGEYHELSGLPLQDVRRIDLRPNTPPRFS